ncbi:hypothetical protein LIER_18425 [Lithospermum erythrorhizon]|uniref:Uncharacterized protein n=1 Tax=Lithospermum erythrorhizon TaxID=34254 RepID=A0AAV3QDY6_LITER
MPLDPLLCVKLAGRPKKSRKREVDEVKKKGGKYVIPSQGSQRCGICGVENHNRRSCPQNPNHGGGRPENGEQFGRGNNTGRDNKAGRGRGRGRGTTDATEASASQSTSQATPRR